MDPEKRIEAFVELGNELKDPGKEEFQEVMEKAVAHNRWFTIESILTAFSGIRKLLEKDKLLQWTSNYNLNNSRPKIIGVIMAGNLPMVGFHDLLSVLISGNKLIAKTSSLDDHLIRFLAGKLIKIEPLFGDYLEFRDTLKQIDAIIATGSNNSSRYFEYYFRHIPSLIRKSRSSVAILEGNESEKELYELGKDIFLYYGLGCRNVSKLYVPAGFKPDSFYQAIEPYNEVLEHQKYANNYQYHRTVYLINKEKIYDNGFLMLRENPSLHSAVSVLHFEQYSDQLHLQANLNSTIEDIQCIVARKYPESIQFGQFPEVWDYADGTDTLAFLLSL